MPKKFNNHEKEEIRRKLINACRDSWSRHKKVSVDDLCRKSGISKGAFYIFFDSKEDVFYQVLRETQEKIYDTASTLIAEHPGKEGVLKALHAVYREYDRSNFIHENSTEHYRLLMSKLKSQQKQELDALEERNRKMFLELPELSRAVDDQLALSTIYTLLMGVKQKDTLPEHEAVFDFLAGLAVDKIYKEAP